MRYNETRCGRCGAIRNLDLMVVQDGFSICASHLSEDEKDD